MSKFLHCTLMNIVFQTLPQVLLAMHLYPVWYLVMLVIINSFPSVIWPLLTFSQKTVRGRVPEVTLHSFVKSVPSMTVAFCTFSTAGGTGIKESKGVISILFLTKKIKNLSFEYNFSQPTFLLRKEKQGDFWWMLQGDECLDFNADC